MILDLGEEQWVYPVSLLDYHEIVNDSHEDFDFLLMYCPLTGTANVWNRKVNGVTTTFGVSGLLYSNNLLPFDRETSSIWVQITGQCINGLQLGDVATHVPVVQTTMGVARSILPNAKVLSSETGFDRNYDRYPYGDYRTNDQLLLYPNPISDNRLNNKDLVLAVQLNGGSLAFKMENF